MSAITPLKGILGSALDYFEVVGLKGKETRQIYRVERFIGFPAP
jgi:hypothetical protein